MNEEIRLVSGLVKNLLMWRFSIIYVWKWYGFYLARSCSVCCLMLTHDIVHTKVSTPDVFVTTDKREPGPRPPVTLSTWVQGHEHLQLAHSSSTWRGRLKKRDKINSTHCGFAHYSLTCSVAESYLPCRIGPTHVLIWAQMRNWLWLNTFANHLGPLVNIHRRAATSQKCPASTCEVQRRLDILIVSRGSVTQCPGARCQEQSYIVVTFPPRPPPVLCVHPLTPTPSVHTLITRGSCNKIPSLYPPILPYLTSFKNASILHAFSFPFKFQYTGIECQKWREKAACSWRKS